MIDPKLLEMIQCPIDGQPLQIADSDLVATLNEKIRRGEIRDHSDQSVSEPLEEGLITLDGKRIYPSRKSIPTLVVDHAIDLD